jgi:hypothetical protein
MVIFTRNECQYAVPESDAIPFNESIKSDIELWHWVKTTIDYSLISYYYKLP